MIGITPDWLTLSGMYVELPPISLRPTTRRAKVTGIRRCPLSMKTISTSSAREMTRMMRNFTGPPSLHTAWPPEGRPATTLAKIRRLMPWPIPRWVISSASHMTKAVPAVMMATMNRPSQRLNLGMRSMLKPSSASSWPWKA